MENHQEPPHVSKDHENFIKDFIQVYKDNQLLWDKSHPKYSSRDARNVALEILLSKSKEYYPDADMDFVKQKIDAMRNAFRREYRKVIESKKTAKSEEDVFVPSLWYYQLMQFTVGEECDSNIQPNEECYKNIYIWTREHTVILIELLKKHPILYSPEGITNSTKGKRMKAYTQITKDLINSSGKQFKVGEVKKKIMTLKQQYRRECRTKNFRKGNPKHQTLWCFELLAFLKDGWSKNTGEHKDDKEGSDDSTDNIFANDDEQTNMDSKVDLFLKESYDDIFDTIGKNVAIKLRDMGDDQRKFAENLINQIMYNGLMENLTADSVISLNGF